MVAAAVAATVGVWSPLVQLLGLEVTAPQGPTSAQRHPLEATAVVGATAVAALAGWALLEVLERVTRSGMKVWTWSAGVFFVLTLPYLPGHSWTDRLALTLLHFAAAAVVVLGNAPVSTSQGFVTGAGRGRPGLRRRRGRGRASRRTLEAMSSVRSVNIGASEPRSGRSAPTGIGKVPVERIEVADPGPRRRGPAGEGVSGVQGDFIGSGRYHGGSAQAVYAVAREELDHWSREVGRDLPDGMFGENITTTGLDVDASEYGDVWIVGGAVLRASFPRVPCATFAQRMGEKAWVRRFAERGRGGTYLAVLEPGVISPGDEIAVQASGSGLLITSLLRAWMGDLEETRTALAHPDLDEESRRYFTRTLASRDCAD